MGGGVFAEQKIGALVTDLGVDNIGLVLDELSLGDVQIGLVLIHNNLIGLGVDLCAQLTLMHPGVVVAAEGLDRARDIGPHLTTTTGLTDPLAVMVVTTSPCVTAVVA